MNCFPPLREEDGAGFFIPPLLGLFVVESDQYHTQGFTLVELITIILVLSVIAALAVPRFVGRNAFDERGFSDSGEVYVRDLRRKRQSQNDAKYA